MTNDYFNDTSPLARHTLARAEAVNTKMAAIEAGFDKLPDDAVLRQMRVAFAEDGGAADAYTATMSKTWASYQDGALLFLKIGAGNTNTGACTVNVDSLGVRSIKTLSGDDPAAGALVAGSVYVLIYDADNTRFCLLSFASTDQANINTVADNISDVSSVASNITSILNALAGAFLPTEHVTFSAGYDSNAEALGTISTSITVTPEVDGDSKANFKTLTNNVSGGFTLATPSTSLDTTMRLRVINGASAGAIDTSAYDAVTGDPYLTTNAKEYWFYIDHDQTRSTLTIREIV